MEPAEVNFLTHVSWVQSRVPPMRVEQDDELTLVDSGLPCDTFNFVAGARLRPATMRARIERAIGHFRQSQRPFSWWVGPRDEPAELGRALAEAGLKPSESELGMSCDLATMNARQPPEGLEIERVVSPEQLGTFAALSAANWNPPDENVIRFYAAASDALLAPGCPLRFYLGRYEGRPVATAEITIAGGAAGLYNLSTIEAYRRRGIGTAMVVVPLLEARSEGLGEGILQAAPDAVSVYRRVGFREAGRYVEYKPSSSASRSE